MKKTFSIILSALMIFSLTACGASATPTSERIKTTGTSKADETAATSVSGSPNESTGISEETQSKGTNVLVVYFSWSGNLHKMAGWIADETGGDRIRVEAKDPYLEDYNATANRAKKERDGGVRPEITVSLSAEELAKYDTVYIGFPVWWYDLPMSMWTFLEGHDLSGKTVIPFFSHEGSSNGASSLSTIEKLAKGADFKKESALSIRGGEVANSENVVREWVRGLKLE